MSVCISHTLLWDSSSSRYRRVATVNGEIVYNVYPEAFPGVPYYRTPRRSLSRFACPLPDRWLPGAIAPSHVLRHPLWLNGAPL